jgi:DNA processing protein
MPRTVARSAGAPLVFDADDPRLAAAAWSRLAEPGDAVAGALVAQLGASGALRWLVDATVDPDRALGGLRRADDDGTDVPPVRRAATDRLLSAVGRWAPRLASLDPRRELRVLERCDGTLLVPGDEHWPRRVDDLGVAAPFALWVRGRADVESWSRRSVAVVGARAATAYGERVAAELSSGLAERGFTVVSGGAYGIDAAAHRGAVAAEGTTCAVLASGVDRFYPQGNDGLLRRIAGTGAVLSEVPPGSAPFRQRFLARNRVIAALTAATVVVEAAHRSGALSTARRAAELLRPVGAVPGPVTSMASAGCHGLLRDAVAVCVTGAAEVADLAGDLGREAAPPPPSADTVLDRLGPDERLLRDALPVRAAASVDALARAAGLPPRRVLTLLGGLERQDLVRREGGRWRRA